MNTLVLINVNPISSAVYHVILPARKVASKRNENSSFSSKNRARYIFRNTSRMLTCDA